MLTRSCRGLLTSAGSARDLRHHLLAWVEMLERDWQRLQVVETNKCSPPGRSCVGGDIFGYHQQMTADELGFTTFMRIR
ncbi:MAG: hypothetical protein Ct9H300mP14_03270 [Gammaproteobacteria bacterium]|nr:MAG: hypothetical protein Ct9H300mP14_03270 [Gammaproteobacteria bacterium]